MKRFLFGTTAEKALPQELTMTLLRVFAGLSMAFGHGLGKLPPSEQLIAGVTAMGFPLPELFAWAASLSEFAGGILLAVGLLTRPSALFVALTMAVAAFLVHAADPFQKKELALMYFVIALIFVARGASSWSLDRYVSKKI